jgi:hypothetical protein
MVLPNAYEEQANGSVGYRRGQREKIKKTKETKKTKSKYLLACHRRIR